MPIYEYLCEKCGHEFEREQRITEDPVKVCPECRAKKVRRLISRTAFVLKGGGWYSDLYSSAKSDAGDKGDKADKGEAKEAKDTSSETKADAKPSSDAGSASSASPGKPGGKGKGKGKSKAA
ncbi:MAG: FmdB family transcriptional regulator [Proteobacteria bacterium]|nr:MAG: FmdB family transcriptional regulator [Pseudomonadota bacterium]